MEERYTINEVAMMTGLTTRTLRNYNKMGFLDGEKEAGVWRFSEESLSAFMADPSVKPAIQAKNKAIVFDFLAETGKKTDQICAVLDLNVDAGEAEEVSAFFCEEINKKDLEGLRFSFERDGRLTRVILSGQNGDVMELLNAYYQT